MKSENSQECLDALKTLLIAGDSRTQEALCEALIQQGFDVNQSKISRLLRKMGAVKVINDKGEIAYALSREPLPPTLETDLKHLILDIVANETLVVVFTSPGCASMVARILDYKQTTTEILATLAGDDTLLVIPKSIKHLAKLHKEVQQLLKG
ncbi:MAG: hypothetical protein FJZ63_01625 [Chlamydiae bacterium]|nr:hypothetical protein [Chlamydiota bacterium]